MPKKSFQDYALHGFLFIIASMSVWIVYTVHDHDIQLAVIREQVSEICHQLSIDTEPANSATARNTSK